MKLTVNGCPHEHQGEGSLPELLEEMKADPARVAIAVNDVIVTKVERDTVVLKEGDRVEVLTLAAGG